MAQYVIANRRAGRFTDESKYRSRESLAMALDGLADSRVVTDTDPQDPYARRVVVVEAEPAQILQLAAQPDPDVIIEPLILHWTDVVPPIDLGRRYDGAAPLRDAAITEEVILTILGGAQPLPNATVKLYLRGLGGVEERVGQSDAAGQSRFAVSPGYEPAAALVVPAGGFWPMIARGAALRKPIVCPDLPADGPSGWWHDHLGIDAADAPAGGGIRVGVADTGSGPHPNLEHAVPVGAFIGGEIFGPDHALDVDAHGTHVAGTIGGRPRKTGEYRGIAAGCDLFVARVFAGPTGGANNADIANAIDALSREHRVDLINLSLGASIPSQVVHDAIIDAAERGTLCLCAAGNDGGAVNYPAAFPEAVAVAALGLAGWGPDGSLAASRLPLDPSLFGRRNLYAANFTSHGTQILGASPGVGIIAPVPYRGGLEAPYGAMDGTSMACPVMCGALAAALSRHATYQALPRTSVRTEAARRLLAAMLQDIGLPTPYQGRGVPSLVQVVA